MTQMEVQVAGHGEANTRAQAEPGALDDERYKPPRGSGHHVAPEIDRRRWGLESQSRQRLESEVRLRAIRVETLARERASIAQGAARDQETRCDCCSASSSIREAALDQLRMHLDEAYECSRKGRRVNEGWAHVFRVDEELIQTYGPEQIQSGALVLAAEMDGTSKISKWRREAIKGLLAPLLPPKPGLRNVNDRPARAISADPSLCLQRQREALRCATKLRDEGVSNGYWLLSIVRNHDFALLAIGGVFQVAFLVVLCIWLAQQPAERSLDHWHAPVLAICAGVLGAVVSAAQRSTKFQGSSIPRQLNSNLASLSRIPLGTVAGLTTWLVVMATGAAVPLVTSAVIANLLLAAFGAGFAERLVVGATSQTREGDSRPETPQRPGSV